MDLAKVSSLLHRARHIVALTGAGVSAESGIPTFRGPGGLWRRFRAEDLATFEAFARDPRLVWEWYNERRLQISRLEPNMAHIVLARWEQRFADLAIVTQNVDGLHRRAGSRKVVGLHGDIWETRCSQENRIEANLETPIEPLPPRCRSCGAIVRPNVVWFGEVLPAEAIHRTRELLDRCDLMLVIGTSGLVYPAAGFAEEAKDRGAQLVEINPEETPLSHLADIALRGKAGEVLSQLDATRSSDI